MPGGWKLLQSDTASSASASSAAAGAAGVTGVAAAATAVATAAVVRTRMQQPQQQQQGDTVEAATISEADRSRGKLAEWTWQTGGSVDAEIKIATQASQTQLSVHFIAARNLCSQRGKRCNSFVRISFYPEGQASEKCQTPVVQDTDFPLYNEQFVMNLPADGASKNLLVSVWNQLGRDGFSEFLGCVTFPLESLMSSGKVCKWYTLLNEIARAAGGVGVSGEREPQQRQQPDGRRPRAPRQEPKLLLPPAMGLAKSPSAVLPLERYRQQLVILPTQTRRRPAGTSGQAAATVGGAFRRDVKSLYDIASCLPPVPQAGARSPEPLLLFSCGAPNQHQTQHQHQHQHQHQYKHQPQQSRSSHNLPQKQLQTASCCDQSQVIGRPLSSLLHCGPIRLLERSRSSEARGFLFPDFLLIAAPPAESQQSPQQPLSLLLDPLPVHRIAHCFVPEGAASDVYLQLAGECSRIHVLRLRCSSESESRSWCRRIQEQLLKVIVL